MGWGSDDGQERRRRPRWMTLLTVLMLLVGGRLFITSASDLHRLVTGELEVLGLDGSLDAQQEHLLRGQVVLSNALSRHRPVSLAMHATARLLLGLTYLFAVAAVTTGWWRHGLLDPEATPGERESWRQVVAARGWAITTVG